VLGGEVKLKTLYGEIVIKIDQGTQNEEKRKIPNYVSEMK
jgi:DnaJ-class molecular chaperone